MSEIVPFEFEGASVRSITLDGEPWFVAADVCAVLAHSNSRAAVGRLPERMRGVTEADTPGGRQRVQIISEPGIYRLVMRSNLPSAERFQDWISEEVIPSIRKHGGYLTDRKIEEVLSDPDTIIRLATDLKNERERRQLAETRADREMERRRELEPKAESWDVLAGVNGDLLVGDAAKILSRDPQITIGRDRLFKKLDDLGWAYRGGDRRWRAMQTAIETGRLTERPKAHRHPDTDELVLDAPQVRVTLKGLHDLHKRLRAEAERQGRPPNLTLIEYQETG